MLADSQAELYAGWSMVQDCALRYDAKPPGKSDPDVSMHASCAKLFCTEMVGRVADRGVQVHGGSGYINEYPVERFYRDVRLLRLYEGTTPDSATDHRPRADRPRVNSPHRLSRKPPCQKPASIGTTRCCSISS